MKISKDEERIISKILNGELSFSNRDFINLETGDSTEDKEKQLVKLADEIKSAVENNNELRKEVEEKIATVEKNPLDKIELAMIEGDIRDYNAELSNFKANYDKNIIRGIILTFVFGIAMPLVASFFTNSTLLLLAVLFTGASLGIVPCTIMERKLLKNRKNLKEKIQDLEQKRFEYLGYKNNSMFVSSVERTKNITKQIYATKDLEISDEEMKNVF